MRKSGVILASASPRRKQLLTEAVPDLNLSVEPADIDESRHEDEDARSFVARMAREKALHVAERHFGEAVIVLAADTIVVHKGQILGKPVDRNHAFEMLAALSDDEHVVMTGVSLVKLGARTPEEMESEHIIKSETFVCETVVKFSHLGEERIERYIESGESMDKAGAYGIQGKAAGFVEWINGSYTNVVGLPLSQTLDRLEHFIWLV